ncbi:hypothetical protein POTOM_054423 [Populus tomentosa]|uniref:DUF4283 domain-containing protein n=1 Tax=Populus tomentosa TaxID=118781 RepID=A0A8X7XYU0_POPTO|nr:hypothetical protein POTOM_054423 [Populus tomentosa]
MELKFVEPVAKNGKELALVNEEDVASEFKRWENAVVAYFPGHDSTFGQPSFSKFINNLIDSEWRKYGNVKVYSKGSGVFVLDFESARGKELALGEGPRFYDGSKPFILKPWSRDMSLEIKELKSAPIWIKLPNLRLHLWSPEALSKIASLVGRPLFADTVTASRETLRFARVCVEVDFEKMLPDSVTIEDDKGYSYDQKVEYEWQPTSRCSFSHGAANTSSTTASGSTPAMSGDEAPVFGANFSSTPAFGSTTASKFGSTLLSTTAPGATSPEDDAKTC